MDLSQLTIIGAISLSALCIVLGFVLLSRPRPASDVHSAKLSLMGIEIELRKAAPGVLLAGLAVVFFSITMVGGPTFDGAAAVAPAPGTLVCSPEEVAVVTTLLLIVEHEDPLRRRNALPYVLAEFADVVSNRCASVATNIVPLLNRIAPGAEGAGPGDTTRH